MTNLSFKNFCHALKVFPNGLLATLALATVSLSSYAGVTVSYYPFSFTDSTSWPESPVITVIPNPALPITNNAGVLEGFPNGRCVSQIFSNTVDQDLDAIAVLAGGPGTNDPSLVHTLHLFALTTDANSLPTNYVPETQCSPDLFIENPSFLYPPQSATQFVMFTFTGDDRVHLAANTAYAFEIWGPTNATIYGPFYWLRAIGTYSTNYAWGGYECPGDRDSNFDGIAGPSDLGEPRTQLSAGHRECLMAVYATPTGPPEPVQLQPGQGVQFFQVDFNYGTELVVSNSDTGHIIVDPAAVLTNSSLTSGFLNVGTSDGWVVYNLPIQSDFPYSAIRTAFKLPTPPGVPLTELDASVLLTQEPLTNFVLGALNSWPVGKTAYNAGGVACSSCATISPPQANWSYVSNFNSGLITNITLISQPSHPIVQAAAGQCWECAVANSLQWMENLYGIVVPDDDVPGLGNVNGNGHAFPTNSLPALLDVAMERKTQDRAHGDATKDTKALHGKLSYMANHGLGGLIMQHQALQNDDDMKNIPSVNGLKSKWMGLPTFDFILTNFLNGADVELAYACDFPGSDFASGHAVDVVAAGYKAGLPCIWYVSDTIETDQDPDDTKGTTTVDFSYVTGPDANQCYHLPQATGSCDGTNGPLITVLVSEMPSPGMLSPEFSQLPGYRLYLNNTNAFGGDRPSDFDWWSDLTPPRPGIWPTVADDFLADGRPIAAVRWWGSYLNSHNPGDEDAFVLSFYTNFPPNNIFPPLPIGFSCPSNLCATYIAPLDKIRVTNTSMTGLDGQTIYEYSVALHDTCLYYPSYSYTNGSAGPTPWAFPVQKPPFFQSLLGSSPSYWLAIAAERGQTFAITNGAWTNYPSGKTNLTEHFWGWHTSPCSNFDASVTGQPSFGRISWSKNTNYFGELDQAFELMTYAPSWISILSQSANSSGPWVQWPDKTCEGVAVLATDGSGSPIVADDFQAATNCRISSIYVWGAWRDDQYDPKAQFRLRIYSDVPNAPSHPGNKLWEKTFSPWPTNGSAATYWTLAAVTPNLCESFWDPSQPAGAGTASRDSKLYEYQFCMDANSQFAQTNGNTYWLSVTTVGTTNQFGWKSAITNDHHLDDAVFATQTNAASGWTDLHYPTNHPFAGHTMDMAFALTTPLVVNASYCICGITIARSNSPPETVTLTGSSMWTVDVGPNGEASDTDTNGLDDVSAGMVQLTLSGNSSLGPVTVRLRDPSQSPYQPSVGRIEECGNYVSNRLDVPPFSPSGRADSFFDIFLEIQIGTNILHSALPAHLDAMISSVPPAINEPYVSPPTNNAVPLLDENDNPGDYSLQALVYIPTAIPPPVVTGISILSPGWLQITWENGGGLQASPTLKSPSWTTITTNSPYVGPITGAMQFYRVYRP